MSSLDQLLSLSPWMDELSPEQVQKVRGAVRHRDFEAGGLVCRKGEPTNVWVGVCDGIVKLSVDSANGKQVSLATGISKGSWFGEGSLLKREPRKYDVVALRKSVVAFMPEETFFWLLKESIAFNRFLLNQFNERLAQFIGFMEYDRLLAPEARVARALASMFNHQLYPGTNFTLEISQEELGNLSGISRQRVNKALQVLQEEQIVDVKYGAITVLDMVRLQTFDPDE